MLNEIQIEGIDTYRLPNQWQQKRILSMARGPNKEIAWLAFGLGMTLQQFKRLLPESKQEVRDAFFRLISPATSKEPSRVKSHL